MLKKVLVTALLLSIVAIDVYLVYTLILNNNQDSVKKEFITIEEEKQDIQSKSEKVIKPKENSQIKQTNKVNTIQKQKTEENKTQSIEDKRKRDKEIEQLIEKIIEEAKMEYHFKNKKKEKENIIKKLLPFGN